MAINLQIDGNVAHSTILAAGRDINFYAVQDSRAAPENLDIVLLYYLDGEIQNANASGMAKMQSFRKCAEMAILDTKILLLITPLEGHLAVSPSYYYESPLARFVLRYFDCAVERRTIRLIGEFTSHDSYLEEKRYRYAKARKFRKYRDAYFSKPAAIAELPFTLQPKAASVGKAGLTSWIEFLETSPQLIIDARDRALLSGKVFESEQASFLWENVFSHLCQSKVNIPKASVDLLRSQKNLAYLRSYAASGFTIPVGLFSSPNPSFGAASPTRVVNVSRWYSLLQYLQLTDFLQKTSPAQLERIRRRPEVGAGIGMAYRLFSEGHNSMMTYCIMKQNGLVDRFYRSILSRL